MASEAEDSEKPTEPHKRRERYRGTHPRKFSQKYKELNPERYAADIEKVLSRGDTPAGGHRSICIREVLQALAPQPGDTAVDATLGHGGHASEILKAILPGGRLYGLDRDPLEIVKTEKRLRAKGFSETAFTVRHMNFADIGRLPALEGRAGFDMILADLGVSSMQIDNPERGFTFKRDGPLDMRMNPSAGLSAAEYLKTLTESALKDILVDYADESEASAIAKVLTQRRGSLITTKALAKAVRDAIQNSDSSEDSKKKSVRRTFQAIRIAVNGEFTALDRLLASLPDCLNPGGRAVILCFHSGEEKRVEHAFRESLAGGRYSSISDTGTKASAAERHQNPRSTSARLWWAIKSRF